MQENIVTYGTKHTYEDIVVIKVTVSNQLIYPQGMCPWRGKYEFSGSYKLNDSKIVSFASAHISILLLLFSLEFHITDTIIL